MSEAQVPAGGTVRQSHLVLVFCHWIFNGFLGSCAELFSFTSAESFVASHRFPFGPRTTEKTCETLAELSGFTISTEGTSQSEALP